jgi:hypothetical protein
MFAGMICPLAVRLPTFAGKTCQSARLLPLSASDGSGPGGRCINSQPFTRNFRMVLADEFQLMDYIGATHSWAVASLTESEPGVLR